MTDTLPPGDLPKEPPGKETTVRCPRLGHQIHFAYCRSENAGLPCFKTLDCWHMQFDVVSYLKEKLSGEDFKAAFMSGGAPKMVSLMDLIQQAKENTGGGSD